MKTPEAWMEEYISHQIHHGDILADLEQFVVAIQRDALNDPFANTTDQQELEMSQSIARNERIRADQLYDQMMKMRARWHEARRYLRAANKGAERNSQVIRLQAYEISQLREQIKQLHILLKSTYQQTNE